MKCSRAFTCVLAIVAGTGIGCGSGDDQGVAVSGEVKLEGQPVEDGMIQFIPVGTSKGRSAGAAIVSGRYSIPRKGGPPPGEYRVEITAYREVRKQTSEELGAALFGRDPAEMGIQEQELMVRENYIPARYNEDSQLTATIPDQRRYEQDFDMQ